MPIETTLTLYTYAELSESAKETARDWWRGAMDESDYQNTIDDIATVLEMVGIDLATHSVQLMGGGTRHDPNIWYSLSYCQGDGASFEGDYSYKAGAAKAIRDYAPQDSTLHAIADALQAVQKRYGYRLTAKVQQGRYGGGYTHSGTMYADCEATTIAGHDREVSAADADEVQSLLRRLADWAHRSLQTEHEYLTSEEQIAETMEANGYTFEENGKRRD